MRSPLARMFAPAVAALLALGACAAGAPPASEEADAGPLDPRWARPAAEELRSTLTPLQWKVTQEDGTEPAFRNEYWDEKREGIYVDRVSGEPLFSSREKYESGTGWPSFWQPLEAANVVTRRDVSWGMVRTEVRSRHGDAHLGHLFDDGPRPTGLRYCMNSAALRFVPVERLEAEGYGEYLAHFGRAAEGAEPAGETEGAATTPPPG